MTVYVRDSPADYREIDRFSDGFGWLAHPEERGKRASHAIRSEGGVWLLDPLWAPDVVDGIDDLGDVVGVAVCSNWHARDADRFARHYDVPVSIPRWMGRVEARSGAPIRRYDDGLGDAGDDVRVRRYEPFALWEEAVLFWEAHGTLYVPETLGTVDAFTVGDERLGVELLRRLAPPRSLADVEPDRILVGHGDGVHDEATQVLEDALAGARRRLPRALIENGPPTVRSGVEAIGG